MNKRLSITVSGTVQGVFFRIFAKKQAQQLGIFGYAENFSDGRVGIVAEGGEEALGRFLAWCKKGSPWARVKEVAVRWENATGEFPHFTIR